MSSPESSAESRLEPTEAEVVRGSAVLFEFMQAGWLADMNPEDLEAIAYSVLKFRGEPGDYTSIEDGAEHWERISQGTRDVIAEHIAGQKELAEAHARSAEQMSGGTPRE